MKVPYTLFCLPCDSFCMLLSVGSLEKKEFREVGYRTPGVLAVENGTLIISRVTEDHAGYYACIASQPSGTDHYAQQQQHHGELGTEISKVIHLLVNGKRTC